MRTGMGRARRRALGVLGMVCLVASAACTQPVPDLTPGTDAVPPPSGGGVVGVNPQVETTPGVRRTVIPYGPYTVPAATGTGHGQEGMLNQVVPGIRKPCTNCFITSMHTNLKYVGGGTANIDTGQWLHHAIFASWPQADATCYASGLGLLGERFFATGNERSRARFPAGYGYQVGLIDSWSVVFDLMNSTTAPTTLEVETVYEWVPASTPGMKPLRPVWIDAAKGCTFSGLTPQTGAYSYTIDWPVNRPGKVIGVGAHTHDGGTHETLTNLTTGQPICTMVGEYGGPGFVEPEGPGHGHGGDDHGGSPPTTDGHGHTDDDHDRMHLSAMTQCIAPSGDRPVATIAWGQTLRFVVYYDTAKRSQKGSHPVMGVVLLYVAAR